MYEAEDAIAQVDATLSRAGTMRRNWAEWDAAHHYIPKGGRKGEEWAAAGRAAETAHRKARTAHQATHGTSVRGNDASKAHSTASGKFSALMSAHTKLGHPTAAAAAKSAAVAHQSVASAIDRKLGTSVISERMGNADHASSQALKASGDLLFQPAHAGGTRNWAKWDAEHRPLLGIHGHHPGTTEARKWHDRGQVMHGAARKAASEGWVPRLTASATAQSFSNLGNEHEKLGNKGAATAARAASSHFQNLADHQQALPASKRKMHDLASKSGSHALELSRKGINASEEKLAKADMDSHSDPTKVGRPIKPKYTEHS